MADTEEPQYTTLAERIAALNKQKNFHEPESNGSTHVRPKKPPPPPPTGIAKFEQRSQTFPVAPAADHVSPPPAQPPKQPPVIPARPPSRPGAAPKTAPPPLPRRTTDAPQIDVQPPAAAPTTTAQHRSPPPIPGSAGRSSTFNVSSPPALPSRKQSSNHLPVRRGSNASELSNVSSVISAHNGTHSSATSIHSMDGQTRKLPPALGEANLPALPPSKREREAAAARESPANKPRESYNVKAPPVLPSSQSTPAVRQISHPEAPARPNLPPRMSNKSTNQPTQPSPPSSRAVPEPPTAPAQPPRRLPPPVIPPVRSRSPQDAQTSGVQNQPEPPPRAQPPPIPGRPAVPSRPAAQTPPVPQPQEEPEDAPPPIPMSSRPSAAQIEAAYQPVPAVEPPRNDCLICRDFSGPDNVAAQYPRESLPRDDVVGYLAHVLCAPFTSLTDKARAIFTWFHHNIAYDCDAFFGNNIRARGGDETIFMGKAVCSGYADTYKAIADRAGLECVVATGHGKGYGHTPLKKGERPPPKKVDGHAWNAVRIDNGEWKLLDACWGAGNVSNVTKTFTKEFKPRQFTCSNETFGLSHYPKDTRYFFRADGTVPTWEEYYIGPVHGEPPTVYTNAHQEGVSAMSVEPKEMHVPVDSYGGQYVRFMFSKVCEHWSSEVHGLGKPPLMILNVAGRGGKKEMLPMNTDGFWWYIDIEADKLGRPGDSVQVVMLTKLDGREARGVSAQEFLNKRGKCSMAWAGVIKWELV